MKGSTSPFSTSLPLITAPIGSSSWLKRSTKFCSSPRTVAVGSSTAPFCSESFPWSATMTRSSPSVTLSWMVCPHALAQSFLPFGVVVCGLKQHSQDFLELRHCYLLCSALLQESLDRVIDAVRVQFVPLVKVIRLSYRGVYVRDSEPLELNPQPGLGDSRAYRASETADDIVLLHGDYLAGLIGCLDDGLGVERLDGVHVDDPRTDALLLELARGFDGGHHAYTAGNNGDVTTLAHGVGLADLEVELALVDDRLGPAPQPHVYGALVFERLHNHLRAAVGVRRHDDRHVGHAPGDRDILGGVVCRPAVPHGEAGVGRDDAHVEVRVGDVRPELLGAAERREHGHRRGERDLAADGEARGRPHHVLFRDAEVEEPLRVRAGEVTGLVAHHQVRRQHHYAVIGRGDLGQYLAIHLASGELVDVQRGPGESFRHRPSPPLRATGFELFQRLRRQLIVAPGVVPLVGVLHKRHALALHRVGDYTGRGVAARVADLVEGLEQLVHVVPVNLTAVPAERAPLLGERLERHYFLGGPVQGIAVPVDDGGEVPQPEVSRVHCRLPAHALFALPVAQQAEHPPVRLVQLAGKGHADGDREPVPQRAGGHLDPGYLVHVRVHAEGAVEVVEVGHHLLGVIPGVAQHRAQAQRAVAFAQDEPVALGPIGVFRVVLEDVVVKGDQRVGHREGATEVAAARDGAELYNLLPDVNGFVLEFQRVLVHITSLLAALDQYLDALSPFLLLEGVLNLGEGEHPGDQRLEIQLREDGHGPRKQVG